MLTAAGGEAHGSPDELRDALLAAAARQGRDGLGPLLDHALTLYPLEEALRDVLAPCLVGIGDGWARGELSVGEEHLTSAAIRARLERTLSQSRAARCAVSRCSPAGQESSTSSAC